MAMERGKKIGTAVLDIPLSSNSDVAAAKEIKTGRVAES